MYLLEKIPQPLALRNRHERLANPFVGSAEPILADPQYQVCAGASVVGSDKLSPGLKNLSRSSLKSRIASSTSRRILSIEDVLSSLVLR